MIKKLKLVVATSALLIGGVAGFAGAQGLHRGAMKQKFDANADGKLDDAERTKLKAAMDVMHAQRKAEMRTLDPAERSAMHQAKTAARFKKLDANADGMLSLDEFKAAAGGRGDSRGHGGRHDDGEGRGHHGGMHKRP